MLFALLVTVLAQSCENPVEAEVPSCFICKITMRGVPLVYGTLENLLFSIASPTCDVLPADLRSECLKSISDQLGVFFAWLRKNLTPDALCEIIGSCSPTGLIKKLKCSSCEIFFQIVENIFGGALVVKEIAAAGKQICELLPELIRTECTKFLVEDVQQVVEDFLKGYSPEQLCKNFGACPL